MAEANSVQLKESIRLSKKFLAIAHMADDYRNNVKALKICRKFIKLERKSFKKVKYTAPEDHLQSLQWKYADLDDAVKRLGKGKNVSKIAKASADLDEIIADVTADMEKTQEELNRLTAPDKAKQLGEKIEAGAQKLSDALNETIAGLKKKFKSGKSSE